METGLCIIMSVLHCRLWEYLALPLNACYRNWAGYCPHFHENAGTLNLIYPLSVHPSICLSVFHKNFHLGRNFRTITDKVLILGMCVLFDKTFLMVPCRDLGSDLWPTSRFNLLQGQSCRRAWTTILWICMFLLVHSSTLYDLVLTTNWSSQGNYTILLLYWGMYEMF